MQAAKEKVSDIAASAKSGLEKTKAVVEEKAETMMSHDPVSKEMAREKKEHKIKEAEQQKQMAYQENAAARQGTSWAGGPVTITSGMHKIGEDIGGANAAGGHGYSPTLGKQVKQDPNATGHG